MTAFFECKELVKTFGGLNAIDHLDISVNKGEIVSIIGPNGAGKTSFFNLVTGFYQANAGQINFQGHNLIGLAPNQITKLGIARTFQNVRLFTNMTIMENVMIGQHCRSKSGILGAIFRPKSYLEEEARIRENVKKQLSFFGTRLSGYRMDQLAFSLSYANRRRLEMARAMATEAKLLLIDEPSAGMNPKETIEIAELIAKMRDERGYTIIVIEHDMKVVKGISDRVICMNYGQKLVEGTYEEVTTNKLVIEAYLGQTAEEASL